MKTNYQNENIETSWKILKNFAGNFNEKTPSLDFDTVHYMDLSSENYGGLYSATRGVIELDYLHSFGMKITIHEFLHFIAGKNIQVTGVQTKIDGKREYQGLNEGLTDLISLEIFLKNYDIIKNFREKYKMVMQQKLDLAIQRGDKETQFMYSRGCPVTGYYHVAYGNNKTYENCMLLNHVIIDYLTFIGVKGNKGSNFYDLRNRIWNDICNCYFNSDMKGFSKIISPVQKNIFESLSEIKLSDGEERILNVVNIIKKLINDSFGTNYSLGVMSEHIKESQTIFHSRFNL